MDDLVIAVNKIADLLQSSTPTWITAVSIIVPIVLTVVSIVLSIRMDKNNEKLQKMLANRDMMSQTRQCILDIYNAYFNGFHILMQANGNIADIFVSDQSYYRWAQDIENATKEITHAYNRTKLLLDDAKLLKQMSDAQTAFFALEHAVKSYIYTGIPAQTIANAWTQFSNQYSIAPGNYYALFQNRYLGETFSKMCETTYTKDIQEKVTVYLELVRNDQFDEPFKKYVQIKDIS